MKKDIFIRLINFLEIEKIEYAILGNVLSYPRDIGSDVDIVINSNNFEEINILINKFLILNQLQICNLLQHEIEGKFFVVSIVENQALKFGMLALDFCGNYMRQGRIILTEKELLNSRKLISQNGIDFWVCCNEIAFIYYLIKKIEKESINLDQFKYLTSLWEKDREIIIRQFYLRFKNNSSQRLIDIFDKSDINSFTKELFKELNHESQLKYSRNFKNQILEFKRKVYRFTKPTGVIISVLGCDGSGKSTVIDQVMNNSNDFEAFRGYKYHHLFPSRRVAAGKPPVLNPHEQLPRSRFMSNVKLMYFLYKYSIGYWMIAYPQKTRSNLVIFDRYYYDILVDPRRYRHNGSQFLTKLIGKIIPKPDLFFIIDAPAEVLQERKQEVTFEESKRQRQAYLDLKNQITCLFIIDNNKDSKIASFAVKKTINDYLINRYNNRYNI